MGAGATAHLDAVLPALLVAALLLYGRGVARLWRKAGVGRGIHVADAVRLILGWLALAAALLSPIDRLTQRSFTMHMLEHEMLMVLAAPLFVLGRPLEAWTFALSRDWRLTLSALARSQFAKRIWRALTAPVGASIVHAGVLWIWHVPLLFVAALAHEAVHVFQHACFFASALAFWWAMFGGAARRPRGISLPCLFATMLHTSALGALLAFAPSPWYAQAAPGRPFGLTPLEDQQVGGLLMLVPGSVAYLVAGLVIVAAWLSATRVPLVGTRWCTWRARTRPGRAQRPLKYNVAVRPSVRKRARAFGGRA